MAMNAVEFLNALEELEVSKGISREVILQSLEEAMIKGYRKQLGGDDAIVRVNIDVEKGTIEMYNAKNIVKEVEDDFLEISLEDAKEEEKKGNGKIVDNEFRMYAPLDELRKATAMSIKSILKQKVAEAEKEVLFDNFKDKIGTMITGKVEKSDIRGCSVNIGRTSVFLPRKEMIADEEFTSGDDIRLYIGDVTTSAKGAHIEVSRANEGFLKCLFNEEIREIYDGTIIIKGIARQAGERSKVAVYSNDPNVDPAGACIGPNGTRIQKIVAQLGNGSAKEKIDVVAFYDNPALYIIESLKPAHVAGIVMGEGNSATAIVRDDSLSLAIGRRGVNVRLAVRLTGYNIDVKTESQAAEEGLAYQTYEELQSLDLEAKAKALQEARMAAYNSLKGNEVLPGLPEGYVAPQERVYEEEKNDFDETLLEKAEKEEIETPKVEEKKVVAEPVKEEVKDSSKEEKKEVNVKTTTTLSDLEKSLEDASNKSKAKTTKKSRNNRKKDEEEEEAVVSTSKDPSTYMSIYTEEELRELEKEESEEETYEDDVDYEDYDEYYDDDDR